MNTNMKELNLNEMEMINGGWKWKDVVCNALFVRSASRRENTSQKNPAESASAGFLHGLPGLERENKAVF